MLLLIDKPKGITSHDVVDVVRKKTGEKRVGHGGTLDPNATGLLIVGVGRGSTKKLGRIAKDTKKEYEAEIILGAESDTDDSEGRIIPNIKYQMPNKFQMSKSQITKNLNSFLGEQEQIPPKFSAIKIKGEKAYELARAGKKVNLKPRKITIYEIRLADYSYPILHIACLVSSGTYIRALARDIGKKLGTGAYLKNLRRTKIGEYKIENAVKLNEL